MKKITPNSVLAAASVVLVILVGSNIVISYNSDIVVNSNIQPQHWLTGNISRLYNLNTHQYKMSISNVSGNIRMGTASTCSMIPAISNNSRLLILEIDNKSQIDVGDIIVFNLENYIITHRVIEKGFDTQGLYFLTKGDHNLVDDGKVRVNQVIGVVVAVIY